MREKIQNRLIVTCDDVDLTTISDVEFYVKQTRFFGCYVPEILSATEMIVTIPYEDAMGLREGTVDLQFAFVDAYGNPRASDTVTTKVSTLLKEVGYDPI